MKGGEKHEKGSDVAVDPDGGRHGGSESGLSIRTGAGHCLSDGKQEYSMGIRRKIKSPVTVSRTRKSREGNLKD